MYQLADHRDAATLGEYIESTTIEQAWRFIEPVQPAQHSQKTKQQTLCVCEKAFWEWHGTILSPFNECSSPKYGRQAGRERHTVVGETDIGFLSCFRTNYRSHHIANVKL